MTSSTSTATATASGAAFFWDRGQWEAAADHEPPALVEATAAVRAWWQLRRADGR